MESIWEDAAVHETAGRPRRRLYRISTDRARAAPTDQATRCLIRIIRAWRSR